MATTISSTFNITVDLAAGTGTTNIATNRAFKVTGLIGVGVDDAVITLNKLNAAGGGLQAMGVVTMQNTGGGGTTVGLTAGQFGVLDTEPNRQVLATDTLRLVRSAANSTRCVIECEAYASETLVES
jgi:hypothetical protein